MKASTIGCLMFCITGGAVFADMMNARIRFEESDTVSQAGRSLCLPAEIVQTTPGALLIEPSEFALFQPANPKAKIADAEGSLSHATVTHMKDLGWRFEITDPGEYVVWMRAWFPLAAGYNHVEQMDDGEATTVFDSIDGEKIDKFGPLPSGSAMEDKWLVPKIWHWYPNRTYTLAKGRHFLRFPPNGAWCGGCLLDRIVLLKQGADTKPEFAKPADRRVMRAKSGMIVSRRIKTERIAKWMLEADVEPGNGAIAFEYSYGGENWTAFKPGEIQATEGRTDYLYIRLRFTGAEKGLQPVVFGYRFRVEKKESK